MPTSYDPYVFIMFNKDGEEVDEAIVYAYGEDEAWDLAADYCEEHGYSYYDWQ